MATWQTEKEIGSGRKWFRIVSSGGLWSLTFGLCYHKVSISTALDYGLDDRGVESWQRMGTFLFSTASRPALGLTQPHIQWVPGVLFLGVKRPRCEADHSPPSSAVVKNAWSYTSTPTRLHGMVLKARDNFTFPLTIKVRCLYRCSNNSYICLTLTPSL
jgi:hypothetical protein